MMSSESNVLQVRVNDELTLDAGWWEEGRDEDGDVCRKDRSDKPAWMKIWQPLASRSVLLLLATSRLQPQRFAQPGCPARRPAD